MPASATKLNACLEVMRDAILQARMWARSGSVPSGQLADLMDAVHDIPTAIQHWEDLPDDAMKRSLRAYDEKWPKSVDGTNGLLALYETVLKSQDDRENE